MYSFFLSNICIYNIIRLGKIRCDIDMKEDKSFNVRNMLVLLFEIIIIVIAIGGLTFATSRMFGSSTIITFGEYNVDYVGKTEIVASDIEPISGSEINIDSRDRVVRLEFSLRGVDTNKKEEDLIYDIMINEMNIDCSLLNEYTKWNLYKNGELLYNGSFSPKFDGNVMTNDFKLTETQQDLPKSSEEYDNYVLIIWISEACEDITTCELIDQSDIVDSVMEMNVFIGVSSGEKVIYERVPNMNATCVNRPILYDNMLPVFYKDGEWRIADKTNSDEGKMWYDYNESRWANSVVVSTDKYKDSKIGSIVNLKDIVSFYVWIPRFKYKLWNDGIEINDKYDAYNKGIDIVFESGTHSTGVVKCNESRCAGKSGMYLTHPSFGDNLTGFWISKYELSDGNKVIPNVESLKNKTIDEYKNIVDGLVTDYSLGEDVESHIVSNLEWGATLYLSHSKYGICNEDDGCKDIGINNTYISEKNKQDTTTRNVYGVYDMAGASSEYVVGKKILGSAISEVRVSDNSTWYNGIYTDVDGDYILRGGIDIGIFSVSDMGMMDVSTRAVLVNK